MIAALLGTTKFSSTGIKPIVPGGKSATCANHRHFAGATGSARPSPAGDPPSDRLGRLVLVCRPPWAEIQPRDSRLAQDQFPFLPQAPALVGNRVQALDRKSTRLNSSHANISYAVFCLKKKKATAPHRHRSSGFGPDAS